MPGYKDKMFKLRSVFVFLLYTVCIVYAQNENEDNGAGSPEQLTPDAADDSPQEEHPVPPEDDQNEQETPVNAGGFYFLLYLIEKQINKMKLNFLNKRN